MNPMIEQFLERPTSHKAGALVAILAVVTFVFWQYFYSGLLEEKQQLSGRIETLGSDIAHEKRLVRDLPKFREEVRLLDTKLKVVLRELPNKGEIAELLDSISGLAREAGLEVSLFQPIPERMKDFYAEVPVSIAVEGTFHQIVTFFDEVGKLPRIVNINDITLKDPQVSPDKVGIKAECVATTFRYLEESERIKAPQDAEGKRRRR